MTKKLEHRIELVVGDWSHDGHEKTDVQFLESNLPSSEIKKAYNAGTKIVGFDFSKVVARNYEEDKISVDKVDKLKSLGCELFDSYDEYDFSEKEGYQLWPDIFTDVYLFICKLGNPDFEYELVSDSADRINIGGYGLFT
jgi:hypothetical protein